MSKTNLEELPVFEGKKTRLTRKKFDLKGQRGATNYKIRHRLILGILHKHLGEPWTKVWRELQQKVKPVGNETIAEIVSRSIDYETWLEGNEVWCQGALGPEPVRNYSCRYRCYYVCPTKRVVMAVPSDTSKAEFQIPEELPSKRPGEKYMRNGDTWFRVGFTPDQMNTMKLGESRLSNVKYRRYKSEPNLGAPLEAKETRSLRLTHTTDHRGFPPQWRWSYYGVEWKQALDRCIGGTLEDVLAEVAKLPNIYKHGFNREVYDINELLRYWVNNHDFLVPDIKWSPYSWRNGLLEKNIELDKHTETLVFTPIALQVGGKELEAIRRQIKHLRDEHENS